MLLSNVGSPFNVEQSIWIMSGIGSDRTPQYLCKGWHSSASPHTKRTNFPWQKPISSPACRRNEFHARRWPIMDAPPAKCNAKTSKFVWSRQKRERAFNSSGLSIRANPYWKSPDWMGKFFNFGLIVNNNSRPGIKEVDNWMRLPFPPQRFGLRC